MSLLMKLARFFSRHHYVKNMCRGCGVYWSASSHCPWTMEQDQWDKIMEEIVERESASAKTRN